MFRERQKKRPASRKQSWVQSHKHDTQQGYATQSEAKPDTPNPHTGREIGLNNRSRGPGEIAHRISASGTRRDVRARSTQGRVAPAKGNSMLPERPRDEDGPREARPASLHGRKNIVGMSGTWEGKYQFPGLGEGTLNLQIDTGNTY
jgi:hypothetical protein